MNIVHGQCQLYNLDQLDFIQTTEFNLNLKKRGWIRTIFE